MTLIGDLSRGASPDQPALRPRARGRAHRVATRIDADMVRRAADSIAGVEPEALGSPAKAGSRSGRTSQAGGTRVDVRTAPRGAAVRTGLGTSCSFSRRRSLRAYLAGFVEQSRPASPPRCASISASRRPRPQRGRDRRPVASQTAYLRLPVCRRPGRNVRPGKSFGELPHEVTSSTETLRAGPMVQPRRFLFGRQLDALRPCDPSIERLHQRVKVVTASSRRAAAGSWRAGASFRCSGMTSAGRAESQSSVPRRAHGRCEMPPCAFLEAALAIRELNAAPYT